VKAELGAYYYLALRDHQNAATVYEGLLQHVPHNIEALSGLAIVYHRFQGRDPEAVALLERVLTVDPRNMRALMLLTMQHQECRQFDRALAYLQQMINFRPEDLDLQADYQRTEYRRTGSWTAFDNWRSSVAADAHLKYSRVKELDVERAVARRDFDSAIRLLDVTPEDSRGWINAMQEVSASLARAGLFYAKGARGRATESARSALQKSETALQRMPNDAVLWARKATLHAMLGERDAALTVHTKAVAVAAEQKNVYFAVQVQSASPRIHALLGDRDAALAELAKQLKRFGLPAHDVRLDTSFASLWSDARFQAIVNDPVNNAPIPFHDRNAYALIK
jgi:tetratricopeptide (TPR) repeat protein